MGSSQTKRYWRVTVSSMANPQCGEIWMSKGYTFNVLSAPAPQKSEAANVEWITSVGGYERAVKWGSVRKTASYAMFLSSAELTSFNTAIDLLDHLSEPFYIKDHEGETWLCRAVTAPQMVYDNKSHTHVSLEVIEVL
jgi:hypothetical protein